MGFEGLSQLRVTFKNGFNLNSSLSGYDICVRDLKLFLWAESQVSSVNLTHSDISWLRQRFLNLVHGPLSI